MNVRRHIRFAAVAGGFLLATAAAFAALLGVTPGVPTTTFALPGTTSYNATTHLFSVTATPTFEAFGAPIGTKAITGTRALTINIQVDNSGALIGGVAGNDLTLTGSIDTNGDTLPDYSGVLLTGEIVAFGSQNVSTTDVYDFRFNITGGALAAQYGANDIGVRLTSESSTFTGSFATNFNGRAKGTLGAIAPLNTARIGDLVWQDNDRDGVQDPGEPGLGGITVLLKDSSGNTIRTTTTDSNGNYAFANLPSGTYAVEIDPLTVPYGHLSSPAGQGGNEAADSNGPGSFFVAAGEQNLTIDFGYYPPATGTIGDVVWNDLDRDGIQDAGEPGINDVTVQLFDSGMNVIATQVTHTSGSQTGYYQFTGLTAGTYYVDVVTGTVPAGFSASPTLVGGDRTIDSNARPTQVILPTDTSNDPTIDFGYNLPASGVIGDFIWNDTNRNGIQDFGDSGIDNVTVYLKDPITNAVLQTTTTTSGGYYEFDGLSAGDYKVEVDTSTLPAGFVASPTLQGGDTTLDSNVNGGIVTLPTDSSADRTIDFGYNSPCSGVVGDRIWNDLDRDGIQDAGEPGLVGITVQLVDPGSNTVLQTTTTGVDGVYTFNGVCAGTYEVRVVTTTLPPGFVATSSLQGGNPGLDSNDSPATVTLATDSSSDLTIDFGYQVPCSGTIGNVVWNDLDMDGVQDAGEPGIDGVTLYLYDALHARIGTQITHDGGQYLFTGVCGGSYTVEVDPTTLPSGYTASPSLQGGDTALDSNALPAAVVLPNDSANDVTIDFGYYASAPAIDIVKSTNGVDADTAPGPYVWPLSTVTWTYVVTNTGDVALSNIVVTDDNGTPANAADDFTASCPKTTLAVGDSMTCSATGAASFGQYGNVGTVTGEAPGGAPVTDSNPSHYYGGVPSIAIEKFTNGADGPTLLVGTAITWTYIVTNVGGMPLTDVTVADNRGVAVTCPKTTLAIGEKMTCTATGTATLGDYTNTGTATGTTPTGDNVNASDDSWYTAVVPPAIAIVKTANPTSVAPFQPVTYTYVVTNTGGVTLTYVTVMDDNATSANTADDFTVTCPKTTLAAGESMTCTATVTPSFATYPASNVLLGATSNYSLLALNGGTMSISSATSITGNVGISSGVDTLSAQKVDAFTGTAYVHTGTAATDFYATYAAATFAPSGGIISDSTGDALLEQANTDAANLKTWLNALNWAGATPLDGSITQALTSSGTMNLYNVSWAYNTKTLTLTGGANDWFIFRSTTTGNTWADSQVILNGVDPNHVLFYFTGATALDFTVNKATTAFQGTIFAPDGEVLYHNPATFNGRIIARNVTVHSDFNITQPPAPTPVTLTNTATASGQDGLTTVTATDDATVTIGSTPLPPPPGTIGNFVWNDLDADGVQDAGEPGIAGVTVVLKNSGGTVLQTTTTNSNGLYQFTGLTAGTYAVQVTALSGYVASPSLQGGDTAYDSNGSPAAVTLPTNSASDMTIDFGYCTLCVTGVIGGVDLSGIINKELFFFADGSGAANWQGASKGFVGNVVVNGLVADERTSGTVPYAGTISTNDTSLGAWAAIVTANASQASASLNQTTLVTDQRAKLVAAFQQINGLTVSPGYAGVSATSLNGLDTTGNGCQTLVINVTSGFAVSSQISITGDACDVFILRWDEDQNFANGYQGEVKFQSGGAIVPLGGLTASNFVHVAGDLASSGGGETPTANAYPQGPRYDNGTGALITGGADFNGGGFFTGYWLTTGAPTTYDSGSGLYYGATGSLSNGIFVGGWYSLTTQFSMTSGTSGVYVSPNCR